MRCHRCDAPIVLYDVNDQYGDYCRKCAPEVRAMDQRYAERRVRFSRYTGGKDLTPAPYGGAAA